MSDSRCKDIPIAPCCDEMASLLMLNDIRESVLFNKEEPIGSKYRFALWWKDCDCSPLNYCPFCGQEIEEIIRGE